MRKIALFLGCLAIVLFSRTSLAQATYPFGTIMKRVYDDVAKPARFVNKAAQRNLNAVQADGSWKDIAYNNEDITNWLPADHLVRLETLIQAYTNKESDLYSKKAMYQSIVKGFELWYAKDPKSSNWWHNEISVPQKLGVMLILMRYGEQQLPGELEAGLIERMKRGDPVIKTGANKTDIATHYFYRALLTENLTLLESSLQQLFEPVNLVYKEEGLQHDFAYLQHGPQLYISGYGAVYIEGVTKIARYVAATPYALKPEKLALFSEFYRNSYLKAIRGRYMDFNVEGRGVSRVDILKKTAEKGKLETARFIDPQHAEDYDAAIARIDSTAPASYRIKPFHKHYWTADYTQHLRPEYSFHVRIASNRTKRSESGNKENLLGSHLSDGATNIQVRGPEYFNIMPVWEWDKIPGVTSRDYQVNRPMDKFWGEDGHNEFAGGVYNEMYGVTAYQMKYDSVTANKAWFFFDKEIVCLGAGIGSHASDNITTTVNQSWLHGRVESAADSTWFYHDGVGYYFPQGGRLKLSTARQNGNWFAINNSFSKDEVSGNVFKLWIDHGVKPRNAGYSYIVFPGMKNSREMKGREVSSIVIANNTEENQAVYHKELKNFQVVFYKPSSVSSGFHLVTADKPCLVMIQEGKQGQLELAVSDPLQSASAVNLRIKDLMSGKTSEIKVDLPAKEMAGSTKVLKLVL